jgi:MATE family multidrug resistance protein
LQAKWQAVRQEIGPMLRLAVPIVAAELGWMLMSIVDTMMVGRLEESAAAIGAVGLGAALFFPIAMTGAGLLLGLDTLVAQAFGAGRVDDCHHSLLNGVYMALALTPLLMGIVFAAIPFFDRLGFDPVLAPLAIPYLKAMLWSALPLLLYFAFRRYLQAMNLVAPVAFALVTANLVNVVANWALIYGHLGAPKMGVEGAGWATCISRVYMAAVLGIAIVRHDRRYGTGLWARAGRPDFARVRELVRLGVPAAVQILIEYGVFAAVAMLAGKLGALPLAAHQIALQTVAFIFMVPLGISSAAAVRVGQGIGRGDLPGATRAGWTALVLAAGFMTCSALALILAPASVARIYSPDPQVIATSVTLFFVAAVFQLFDGIQVVATGALRGAGDTRTPMILHGVIFWGVGLPCGYALGFRFGHGVAGLWVGLCIGLILVGSTLLVVWHRRMRQAREEVL